MPLNTNKPDLGKGVTLSYCLDLTQQTPTYLVAATVISVNPSFTVGEVEYVTLATLFKTYLPTLPEAECDFGLSWIPGDPAVKALETLYLAPRVVGWRITLVDGSTISFPGFLKSLSPSWENEAVAESDSTIRITGAPSFTDPS